jgi:RNA polymerase sigma-70 factor, ECF subfamily
MTYATTSASFAGRTGAGAVDKHRLLFRGRKRNARFSAYNPASSGHRSAVETRSETPGLEAFEEMAVASRSRFLRVANAILRNSEDAEDAVQNALLSGYLHLHSFDGRSALTTWFTRIVLNAALMIRRKRKSALMSSQLETDTSDDAGWIRSIPSEQPGPETVCAERETLQFINDALQKMTPALRQAITMTYLDEMSAQEARAVLGVSKAAFKSRLLRARRQLLKQVQPIQTATIRTATRSFADKNPFQALVARQPEIESLELSLS